jgi:glycosyltransferase involved in cell wall biosynthesis
MIKQTIKNFVDNVLDSNFSGINNRQLYKNVEIRIDDHSENEIKYWFSKYFSGGRLALIVTSLSTGGTERYVRDLAIGFAKIGLNPIVIIDKSENQIGVAELRLHGVELIFLGVEDAIDRNVYCELLKNVIVSKNIKLLHDNTWFRSDWIYAVCSELRIYHLTVCHSTFQANVRTLLGLVNTFDNIWLQRINKRKNKLSIISTSKMSTIQLGHYWGGAANIATVYLGVPLGDYYTKTHNPVSIKLIWIGSFIERKKPLNMLMAFEEVLNKYPLISLVMLGEGPLLPTCRKFVEERFPDNVLFTGFVENVFEYLNEAQIFVMTSDLEGLSYVTLEAMACGLPVIVTDCGVVKEVVIDGETGFVVRKDDIHEISTAIQKLAGDFELVERMGEKGFNRCKSNFSLQQMIKGTLNAYKSLMDCRL